MEAWDNGAEVGMEGRAWEATGVGGQGGEKEKEGLGEVVVLFQCLHGTSKGVRGFQCDDFSMNNRVCAHKTFEVNR